MIDHKYRIEFSDGETFDILASCQMDAIFRCQWGRMGEGIYPKDVKSITNLDLNIKEELN